jgi:hypothetical protein
MPVNASESRMRARAFPVMLEKLSVLATVVPQFVAFRVRSVRNGWGFLTDCKGERTWTR